MLKLGGVEPTSLGFFSEGGARDKLVFFVGHHFFV